MAPAIFSALAFVASIQAGPTDSSQLVTREAWVMGTRLSVIVEATSLADASQASENVIREVERLGRMLSTWDPQTEMHAINTAEVGQLVTPAPELAALLAEAERYSRTSHAAFDARVGALVDAWDLRGAGDVPAARELLAARNATGAGAMSIDERTGVVVRHMPAAWIDTGGFGKGAALRAAARGLEADGVDRALIDLGGQLWAQGSAQKPWSVYIAHPEQRQRRVARLEVHGVSVATSGTSERFIEAEGMRWGHILDPRTGQPAPAWGSVTVVSADPVEADALATALYVMGPQEGRAWAARHPEVDALFLEAESGALAASWTGGMEQWLVDAPVPSTAPAQAPTQQVDTARIAALERRIEAVTRELERLQLGRDVVEADSSIQGLGPAASKVYRVNQGVSLGGYGEFLYQNFAAQRQGGSRSGALNKFDALRAILYVGYKFNDRLIFNSELEIEHAKESFLEFAYLDYLLSDHVGVRGGMLLAPLGLVNELHEPPVFLGTERPVTENRIIPTTWRENGIGLFGSGDAFSWRLYLMNSFNGAKFSAAGLRGGRQNGSKALAEDMGVAGRFDYTGTPGLLLGLSAYSGETAQGQELGGQSVGGRVRIWDAHFDYKTRGWDLRALVAGAQVSDVADMNALIGLEGAEGIGTDMLGWYVQAGYDVLRTSRSPHQLIPYVRYERVNTQRGVASGFSANPATDLTVTSIGAAWRPISQAILKLDYQIHSTAADTGVNQLNASLGWLF